jgi:carbonic anhydrase
MRSVVCCVALAFVFACKSKDVEHPSPSANPSGSAEADVAAASASGAPASAPSGSSAPVAAPSGSASSAPSAEPAVWTYGGSTGPSFWGDIKPEFAACKGGQKQSPVDVPGKVEAGGKDAPRLSVDYLPVPLAIQNDGRGVRIANSANNYVTVAGKRFELLEINFHSPSEHTLAGKRFEIEMQLVHKSSEGKLAVVAVLFAAGETAPGLAEVWKKLPKQATREPVLGKGKPFDVAPLVALSDGYYTYEGSQTMPPCTEGVTWFVMKKTPTIAAKDVERYRALFGGRTNRMVMPLGDRRVIEVKP